MRVGLMEYSIAGKEINRRIYAFARLSVSLLFGTILNFILFPIPDFTVVLAVVILLTIFLLLLLFITLRSFSSLRAVSVKLLATAIERIDHIHKDKIAYDDITAISTVWGTRKQIREIKICTKQGEFYILNGLNNLEQLYAVLRKKTNLQVKILENHEPIDYDHPLFYVVLGLVLGTFISLFVKQLFYASSDQVHVILFISGVYNLLLAFYFLAKYPISKRYGQRTKVLDYVLSAFLGISGVLMIWVAV